MSLRRENLLKGICNMPKSMKEIFDFNLCAEHKVLVKELWNALWHCFLMDSVVSSIVWYEKFNDKDTFNNILRVLCDSWIHSEVSNNYATLSMREDKIKKWLTDEEINNLKFQYKSQYYLLGKTKSTLDRTVQIGNMWVETGLYRPGFMKAGNNQFRYDTEGINKYAEYISFNIDKGYNTGVKEITYNEIVHNLVEYYGVVDNVYTLGNNVCDSRGRSIFQCGRKVFNPVSSKDARASIKCPKEPLSEKGKKAVYAFISELFGYRGTDYEDKVDHGYKLYLKKELPSLENMKESKDFDDLHARIWLERIYRDLDNNVKEWDIPIEIDAMASMLQFVAVLTNDYTYMDRTNLVNSEHFEDAWYLPYCSRLHVKKAVTPKLYGSNAEPVELWDKNKLSYTQSQVNSITEEIRNGIFANANNFKDFIIQNVNPQESMKVKIWNEEFWIRCNRFLPTRTKETTYWIYTEAQGLVKKVIHHDERVPDLESFHRFFQTLLLHHLDSRVADYICQEMDWVLPNHDAFVVHPNHVMECRKLYTDKLYEIYKDRHMILKDYFKSIGITKEWEDVDKEEVKGFEPYCLK